MTDEQQAQIRAAWERGATVPEIVEQLGLPRWQVKKWRLTLGLTPRPRGRNQSRTPPPDGFADMVRQGVSGRKLRTLFDCGEITFARWCAEAGVAAPTRREAPPPAPKAPVTPKPSAPVQFHTMTEVEAAAHYLRKFYACIHKADIVLYHTPDVRRRPVTWGEKRGVPNKGAGYYYVDSVGVVANDGVLQLAVARGWRREA